MGNKQASGELVGSCQKTEISPDISLLKPLDQQNFSALQISSKTVATASEMYLKILRHPNILRYVESHTENGQLVIVVEKCSLLDVANVSDQEICNGLHSILTLVEFLHNEVKLCGIDFEHIFVTGSGTWKIGLFHTARKITSKAEVLMDLQQLAEFAVRAVGRCSLPHSEELEIQLRDMLEERRLDEKFIPAIKSHSFFSDPFLETVTFLDNFLLKSQCERKQFFQNLDTKLTAIPEEAIAKQLSAKLLSRHVVLDETAQATFLPRFLTPVTHGDNPSCDGVLSLRLFKDFVIPEVVRIFHVREVEVRLVFLKNFHRYFRFIEKPVLVEDLLPEIMLGIRDTHDALVAETLNVLAHLVNALGSELVMGGNRLKIFADGRPKRESVSHVESSIRERLNPINGESPRSVPRKQFSGKEAKTLPERVPPEGGEDIKTVKTQPLVNEPEVELIADHSIKDEEYQGWSLPEGLEKTVFNEPGSDHSISDEKYQEWSAWDNTAEGLRIGNVVGAVFNEPQTESNVDHSYDKQIENMTLNNPPKTWLKGVSVDSEWPENNDDSDWSGWDKMAENLNNEHVVGNTLGPESENVVVQKELSRKPTGKVLSLKAKGKETLGKPPNSIKEVNTPSENQILRHNALPLSSKSLVGKSKAVKTNDHLGSEFDVMAIELKVKQEEDPDGRLFEEFFGDFSYQPAQSLKHEVEEKAGFIPEIVPKKNIFAAVPVEEGDGLAEEGSGWDDF